MNRIVRARLSVSIPLALLFFISVPTSHATAQTESGSVQVINVDKRAIKVRYESHLNVDSLPPLHSTRWVTIQYEPRSYRLELYDTETGEELFNGPITPAILTTQYLIWTGTELINTGYNRGKTTVANAGAARTVSIVDVDGITSDVEIDKNESVETGSLLFGLISLQIGDDWWTERDPRLALIVDSDSGIELYHAHPRSEQINPLTPFVRGIPDYVEPHISVAHACVNDQDSYELSVDGVAIDTVDQGSVSDAHSVGRGDRLIEVRNLRTGDTVHSETVPMQGGYMSSVAIVDSGDDVLVRHFRADHIRSVREPYHFHNGGTWLYSLVARSVVDTLQLRYVAPHGSFLTHSSPSSDVEGGLINDGAIELHVSVLNDSTYGTYLFDIDQGAAEVGILVRRSDTSLGFYHWNMFDTAGRKLDPVDRTDPQASPGRIRLAHVSPSTSNVSVEVDGREVQGSGSYVDFLSISVTDTARNGSEIQVRAPQKPELIAERTINAPPLDLTTVFLYDRYETPAGVAPVDAVEFVTPASLSTPIRNSIRLINLTDVAQLKAFFVAGPNKGETGVAGQFQASDYAQAPWTYQDVYLVEPTSSDTVATGKIGFDEGVSGSLVAIGSYQDGTIALYRIQDAPEPNRRELHALNPISGVNNAEARSRSMTVNPNPGRNNVTLTWDGVPGTRYATYLYSSTGERVASFEIDDIGASDRRTTIDISDIPGGIYRIIVSDEEGRGSRFSQSLIIAR